METIAATRKFADIYTNLNLISPKTQHKALNTKNLNIMIVDADGVASDMLAEHLNRFQRYNVRTFRAQSLADAVHCMAINSIELVLLADDYETFAGKDIFALYAGLKNEVPVLFLSNGTTDDGFERVNFIDADNLTPALLELTIRNALHLFKIEKKLEHTTTKLNEVESAKDNFFAHVSHDLKTPLNAILGYSEALMLGAFGPLDNSNVADTLTIINRAGTNLLGAINELIVQVSSVDYLKKPVWEVADINEIIRMAVSQVEVFANCRQQQIVTQFDATLCLSQCDRNAVTQAVTNVLTNAIQCSPELKDIKVTTRDCGKQVEIAIHAHDIGLIETADSGANMRGNRLEKPADTANGNGGLGLSILRSVVDIHHGHLELSNADDEAAMIKIVLPRKRHKSQ